MPRKHLASLARENEAALKTRYARHLAGHSHAQTLADLHATCEPVWTVSISATADRVYNFLKTGTYYNKYRSEAQNAIPVFSPDQEVVHGESPVNWAAFGPYLRKNPHDAVFAWKREAFNRFAQHEEHFAYGAYHVRGEGASGYGEFQMIFSRNKVLAMEGLSFLQQDSLKYCRQVIGGTATDWEMDEAQLMDDLASAKSVTVLMCLKMEESTLEEGLDYCIGRICVPDEYEYVEAQFEKGYTREDVGRIVRPQLNKAQLKVLTRILTRDPRTLDDRLLTAEERKVKYYLLVLGEANENQEI
jgi:hypothetical protein